MSGDFNHFVDSILVKAADRQNGSSVKPISMRDLASSIGSDMPPTWIAMAEDRIRQLHYGELYGDSDDRTLFYLEINGAGLARANDVRLARAPKPLVERLASERTQRLLNVVAFGVSLISLVVAILALIKSGT